MTSWVEISEDRLRANYGVIREAAGMGIALSVATVAAVLAAHVELPADGGGVVVFPATVAA